MAFSSALDILSYYKSLYQQISLFGNENYCTPIDIAHNGQVFLLSTGARELYDAGWHAIHHFAIIGGLLRERLGPDAEQHIPSSFGFIPGSR